ncbi:MAG: hypothetical protein A2169_01135 [Deltaproteobacteria bacterium RBG_13_47_9]|nr:MAG: hypothetical protein A2169_01135 [Deltaproteobacteria bacterium RBG_13_47_9]
MSAGLIIFWYKTKIIFKNQKRIDVNFSQAGCLTYFHRAFKIFQFANDDSISKTAGCLTYFQRVFKIANEHRK